jgi:hypothetical protein
LFSRAVDIVRRTLGCKITGSGKMIVLNEKVRRTYRDPSALLP